MKREGVQSLSVGGDCCDCVRTSGACESSMACSTCHVVLEDGVYESLEPACEDEEDMLDMAFGLTDTYVVAFCCVNWTVLACLRCTNSHARDGDAAARAWDAR